MISKKVLPMTYPPVDSVARHAFFLSAICNHEQSYPWIYSNYICLVLHDSLRNVSFTSNNIDYYRIPWIETTSLYRDMIIKLAPDLVSFFKSCVDDNWYVHTKVNEYYIEACRSYRKDHFTHNIMIHGYDEEYFHIAGFFNEPLKYGFDQKIRIADFMQAFHDIDPAQLRNWQIQLFRVPDFKKLDPKKIYKFDVNFVADSIRSFINSTQVHDIVRANLNIPPQIYGLNIYQKMIHYIEQSQENDNIHFPIRMTGMYTILNHKRLMLSRIEYMHEQQVLRQADRISEQYERLKILAQRLIVELARLNKAKRISFLADLKKILMEIHALEKDTLEFMLDNIIVKHELIR